MHLQFVERSVFESFDEQHIDGSEVFLQDGGRKPLRVGFFVGATFVHQRPSSFGDDQHLVRARFSMGVGILAFAVDIEAVVSVFHGRDAHAFFGELFHQRDDEPRFAATAPPCDADDLHRPFLRTFPSPCFNRAKAWREYRNPV